MDCVCLFAAGALRVEVKDARLIVRGSRPVRPEAGDTPWVACINLCDTVCARVSSIFSKQLVKPGCLRSDTSVTQLEQNWRTLPLQRVHHPGCLLSLLRHSVCQGVACCCAAGDTPCADLCDIVCASVLSIALSWVTHIGCSTLS